MQHRCVVGLLLAACSAASQPALATFREYPQTEAFVAFTRAQVDRARHPDDLLSIETFGEGEHADRVANAHTVTTHGQAAYVREVYDWAHQNAHSTQVAAADLTRLASALRRLPASVHSLPIERLVIISFRDGDAWVTRTYDRQALSTAMREIDDIVSVVGPAP